MNKDNDADKDNLIGKEEDNGEEEDTRKNISKSHFKLLLPPIDIRYTSKKHFYKEV